MKNNHTIKYIEKIQELERFFLGRIGFGVMNQMVDESVKYNKNNWHYETMTNRPPHFWLRITKGDFYRLIVVEELAGELVYVCYTHIGMTDSSYVNMVRNINDENDFMKLVFGSNLALKGVVRKGESDELFQIV